MKRKNAKELQALSFTLCLCLIFSAAFPGLEACAEDAVSVNPSAWTENALTDSPMTLSDDAEKDSGEMTLSAEIGAVNEGTGLPEGPEEFPGNSDSAPTGSDVSLGFGDLAGAELVYDDESVSDEFSAGSEENAALSGVLDDIFKTGLSASPDSIVLQPGESRNVAITFSVSLWDALTSFGNLKLQCGSTNNALLSVKFGKQSGKSVPVTISAKRTDSPSQAVIVGFRLLKASNQKELATASVRVLISQKTPALTLSGSQFNIRPGGNVSVTAVATGYSGSRAIRYSTTNSRVADCAMGAWAGAAMPIRVNGKSEGSATITVYLCDSSGNALASQKIYVVVTPYVDVKLTVSAETLSLDPGDSATVHVSYSGYSGPVYLQYAASNLLVCHCAIQDWSGNSAPVSVKGLLPGHATVTFYLKSKSGGKTLAAASIRSVSVTKALVPQIAASPSSVSMKADTCAMVKFTVSGVSGKYYLCADNNAPGLYALRWGDWSGDTAPLVITGKNPGNGKISVSLKNSADKILKTMEIPVSVSSAGEAKLSASSKSVTVGKNQCASVKLECLNCYGKVKLRNSVSGGVSCSWGSADANSTNLIIRGVSKGPASVTVDLLDESGKKLDSLTISVNVSGSDISDYSFSFENYSAFLDKPAYERIYGKTKFAQELQRLHEFTEKGEPHYHGVCYGMASVSGMISTDVNDFSLRQFRGSPSLIGELKKGTINEPTQCSLQDLIEAMYTAQFSPALKNARPKGLSNVVNTIQREIDAGRPALIGLFYSNGGHAVLGYDYSVDNGGMNITIYDNNKPNVAKSLRVIKDSGGNYSSWTYSGANLSGDEMVCDTINILENVWRNRGKEEQTWLERSLGSEAVSSETIRLGDYNLLITRENDFQVSGYRQDAPDQRERLIAECVDGTVRCPDDSAWEVREASFLPDDSERDDSSLHMIYMPVGYYTMTDTNETDGVGLDAALVNVEQFVSVTTAGASLDFYAVDAEESVGAMLNAPAGQEFTIVLGSSLTDEPDRVIRDIGSDQTVGASLENGTLGLIGMNDSDTLSVGAATVTHSVYAHCGEGGSLTPKGLTRVDDGESLHVSILPEEGHKISAVYLDGEYMGTPPFLNLENIRDSHEIRAEFKRDISDCVISRSADSNGLESPLTSADITVAMPDGSILTAGRDYEIHFTASDNPGTVSVLVLAAENGMYSGFAQKNFAAHETRLIENVLYDDSQNCAQVHFQQAFTGILSVALYEESGKMSAVRLESLTGVSGDVILDFSGESYRKPRKIKAFLLDYRFLPIEIAAFEND